VNRQIDLIARSVAWLLAVAGALAVFDFFTGWLIESRLWKALLACAGLLGLYHLIADTLQTRKLGLRTILNWLAERRLARELEDPALGWVKREWFVVAGGQVQRAAVRRGSPVKCEEPGL
jgi:hypothetical protein